MDLNDNLRINRKFRNRREIRIEPDMFYSEAFKGLSASAMKTLMRCLQKRTWIKTRKGKPIYSNDGFIFPYAEAQAVLDIGTTQFYKNIIKLIELGFIDLVHQGGWYQKNQKQKDFSIYKLSDRWRLHGKPGFKEGVKTKTLQPEFYIRHNLEKKKMQATSQKRSCQLLKNEVDSSQTQNSRLHKNEVAHLQAKCATRIENTMQEGTMTNAVQLS